MKAPRRIILCWACEEKRAVTYRCGQPLCEDCFEHFTAPPKRKQEYITADVARDLTFGGDVC